MTTALAGATKACDYTAVIEGMEVVCVGGKLSIDGQGHVPHPDCVKGRVYVFDETVRIPCPDVGQPTGELQRNSCMACRRNYGHSEDCYRCTAGLGWTASEDGWVWWRAAAEVGVAMGLHVRQPFYRKDGKGRFRGRILDSILVNRNDDPKAAFFAALERAVVAQGAELLEE